MSNILDDHIEETFQNKPDSVEVIRRNMEVGYQKMMQFRIKSITLLRHFVLGNIHLDLWHENDNADSDIYSTVIIGVNGIGKSHMLCEQVWQRMPYGRVGHYDFPVGACHHWHHHDRGKAGTGTERAFDEEGGSGGKG